MIAPNNIDAFYALLRAGLWENRDKFNVSGIKFQGPVDWDEIYQLAEEQSVVGLVLAGIEHSNVKPPQELLLQWIGEVQMLEQQNKAMNSFIAELVEKMREADIYTLLVKGQGIAKCYERPLWRACGDVDFLLSDTNYKKAKGFLIPLAESSATEEEYGKHLGLTIDSWIVELHGTLRGGLSRSMDMAIDEAQRDVFFNENVRTWINGKTQVFLPSADNDVIFVFTHYLKHFYKEGIGLRQICDWCRLLSTYKGTLKRDLLEVRLRRAGVMKEWKTFAAFSVEYLGMPVEDMPLYDSSNRWQQKAKRISSYIIEEGRVAQERDLSFYGKKSYMMQKVLSMRLKCKNLLKIFSIFPGCCVRYFPFIVFNGIRSTVRGEGKNEPERTY